MLHFGASSIFSNLAHVHVATFLLVLFEVVIVGGLLCVVPEHLVQVVWVHVGVEVGHDGEDDAYSDQQASKEEKLHPLRTCTYTHYLS